MFRIDHLKAALTKETDDCMDWPYGKFTDGYGSVYFDGKNSRAHCVAWKLHNETKIPDGMLVRHTCDNPACFNPKHLLIGTHAQNCEDRMVRGRHARLSGEKNGNAKINEDDVKEIRKMRAAKTKLADISSRFGISQAKVSSICLLKSWRHVA